MLISGSELIYQTTDQYGKIEVIDYQQKIRSLHFGNLTQQSAMLLKNPFVLVHKYTQAMLLPTCWLEPKNVLILGLGSGSIAKHLYNYFQDSNIDAVELREKVIDIAYEYFLIPETNDRFTIYNESAYDWLDSLDSKKKYNLIIVDMFLTTQSGKNMCINVQKYIQILYDLLDENGVVVFNHLGNNVYSYPAYHDISEIFSHNLFSIDIESVNSIIFATRGYINPALSSGYLGELEAQYALPYTYYYNRMNKV